MNQTAQAFSRVAEPASGALVSPSAGPAIKLAGVSKSFDGRVAVQDLDLTVERGATFGFVGPNGSGKTTTLRMIMSILLPDRGDIRVLGSDPGTARDRVSYLPEERGLYRKMTVRHLISYYGQLKGADPKRLQNAVREWLQRMGLSAYAEKRIETLSKGMAQKVQFIAAVVADPELVILDEPFSGLDPVNAEVLKEAVTDLRRRGVTVLFSTHDMAMAERLCDRVCMIFKGRKVLDGTLEDIQAQHGQDTLRVRTAAGAGALRGLPGVELLRDHAGTQELRFDGDPQVLLRRLVAQTTLTHFEVVRPTLHEIFVRIARPEGEVYHHA
jgi:ABC-2 type transport system ATP-binding protein